MIKIVLITALYSVFIGWYLKHKQVGVVLKTILLFPIVMAVFWSFVLEPFVMTPIKTADNSMLPAFEKGHYYMVNRLTDKNSLARGTVIVFKDKEDSRWLYKRIVGLPGEKVSLLSGKIYINDKELPEPYISETSTPSGPALQEGDSLEVPSDNYFVLGDNRGQSKRDSLLWGNLPEQNIIGTIWFKYY